MSQHVTFVDLDAVSDIDAGRFVMRLAVTPGRRTYCGITAELRDCVPWLYVAQRIGTYLESELAGLCAACVDRVRDQRTPH